MNHGWNDAVFVAYHSSVTWLWEEAIQRGYSGSEGRVTLKDQLPSFSSKGLFRDADPRKEDGLLRVNYSSSARCL